MLIGLHQNKTVKFKGTEAPGAYEISKTLPRDNKELALNMLTAAKAQEELKSQRLPSEKHKGIAAKQAAMYTEIMHNPRALAAIGGVIRLAASDTYGGQNKFPDY